MKNLNQNEKIAVATSIIVVIFFLVLSFQSLIASSISNQEAKTSNGNQVLPDTLVVQDLIVGTGLVAENGKKVSVHYTGQLADGTIFDSSLDRRTPISFILGSGQVIPGWEQGIQGMQVGGKRILIIPPELAYGTQGIGPIPPNATLIFEVDLIEIQ